VSTCRTIHPIRDGYQEEQTSTFVQARLRDPTIPRRAAKTGVVSILKVSWATGRARLGGHGRSPIDEQSGVSFSEVPGVMHACGHDAQWRCCFAAEPSWIATTFAGR
jgi:metal-dependent amidase/aminoacylase/carboxypeptidase family protein